MPDLVAGERRFYLSGMLNKEDFSSGPQPGSGNTIAVEAANVLESPAFQRSEVLSRLLKYLVQMTAEGRSVKAFEIAVDGLGRDERESVDSDTYARVVVARLRKALAQYYATGSHQAELYIDPGSYVVRLKSPQDDLMRAETTLADLPPPPARERWASKVAGLVIVLIVIVLFGGFLSYRNDRAAWVNPNFPIVSVARFDAPVSTQAEECRSEMIAALGGYTGVRLVEAGMSADYEIQTFQRVRDGKPDFLVRLMHLPTKRFLWSYSAPAVDGCLDQTEIQNVAYAVASPGGLIESFSRRTGVDPDTLHGCWLQFTQSIKTYNTIGNADLENCASDWYAANSAHPVAAFLYSWTLMDRVAVAPLSGSRTRMLNEASDIARDASLLNSEYASLYIAKMRAASFRSDRKATIAAARRAIKHAQGNPVIIGMAASGMAMWNDPEGERILHSRAERPDQQMPWENVALFVAAMMRDDPKDAGEHIGRLSDFDASQPVLQILRAAHLARIGKRQEADAVLARMESNPRIWIAGRETLIGRLPMAPEVKAQLQRWLAFGA